ncbi:hypothetical protein ACWC9U_26570 [Streptomyces sp. 900116325]
MADTTQREVHIVKQCRTNPRSVRAWEDFRAAVEARGGVVLEPRWLGATRPHRAHCVKGHDWRPSPTKLQQGRGGCRFCSRRDSGLAREAFKTKIAEIGGVVLGPWVNTRTSIRIRCAEGHECAPQPANVLMGRGACRTCSGRDSDAAWAAFRARVEELGGMVLESAWKGALAAHRIRCRDGHVSTPYPNAVKRGVGICGVCAGKTCDVVYVVRDEVNGVIKFGITSGDPRPRLGHHARDGFDQVVRLHAGLPADAAPELETMIGAAPLDAGEAPVRGREYFSERSLPVVLDLVDNHPAVRS